MRASERMLKTWNHQKFDLSTDSRLVFAPGGALIGYAHVRDVKDPPVEVFAGYSVRLDYDFVDWLWDDLFGWMEAEARRVIPKAPEDARIALVAGTSEQDVTEQRELERHGFEHSRTFHRMTTGFEEPAALVALPDGIAIRTFKPGADDKALVAAYREAFSGHYSHLEQPFDADLAEWRHWMGEDDFDPSLWFLACGGDEILGFCTCYPEAPGDAARGHVDELSVRPAWRRCGIAQALLLRAFGEFQRRGIGGAILVVDTENRTGAPALYERVGMHPGRVNHTYVKELRPVVNLVPQ